MQELRLTTRLTTYWNRLRQEDEYPKIQKLNPGTIEDIWPQCFMISVDMHAGAGAEVAEVVLQLRHILPARDVARGRIVKRLDSHLKLHAPVRELREQLAQLLRQPIRHHLEMHEHPLPPAFQKELQDRARGRQV